MPIETGPARTQLASNTGEGGDYESEVRRKAIARAVLGGLKERMRLGGIITGAMRQVLSDGTEIVVRSILGQGGMADTDSIRISQPVPVYPQQSLAPRKRQKVKDLIICGSCFDNDSNFLHAVLWENPEKPPIDLGLLPNGYEAEALDISEDGLVVVGSCGTINGTRAFRWTKKMGMIDLGNLPTLTSQLIATGVSEDGGVICGYGTDHVTGRVSWWWTEDAGVQLLPDNGYGTGSSPVGGAPNLRVSPSGRYITGLAGEARSVNGLVNVGLTTVVGTNAVISPVGVLWEIVKNTPVMTRVPSPGTSTTYVAAINPSGTFFITYFTNTDDSIATDVTDDGLVIGYSTHRDNGNHTSETGLDAFNPTNTNCIFYWDSQSGVYTLHGDGYAVGIANDTSTGAGNTSVADHIYVPDHIVAGNLIGAIEVWDNLRTHGWSMEQGKEQVSLGEHTYAYDISEDGDVVVGKAETDINDLPALWDDSGQTMLPLLPNTYKGYASAVAVPELEF